MDLKVLRVSSQNESTVGLLFEKTKDGDIFLCFTLEDQFQHEKVYAETRIPCGTYKIDLLKSGKYHERYIGRYGDFHKGMLWIKNVPNFSGILIHTGNTDDHTAGCLLLGDAVNNNVVDGKGFIGASGSAYKRIYPIIANELDHGGNVTIEYIDYDLPSNI